MQPEDTIFYSIDLSTYSYFHSLSRSTCILSSFFFYYICSRSARFHVLLFLGWGSHGKPSNYFFGRRQALKQCMKLILRLQVILFFGSKYCLKWKYSRLRTIYTTMFGVFPILYLYRVICNPFPIMLSSIYIQLYATFSYHVLILHFCTLNWN